jgi:hypothetical protein
VTEDHERIEELLAGYTLLSLDGEDAAEADRILAEHVPSCFTCRQTLSDLQGLAGDLALATGSAVPPDLLLPRIHAAMDDVPRSGSRARRGSFVALAASVVALVAMGGLSFTMASRASQAEDERGLALEMLSLMRSPGVDPVSVDPQAGSATTSEFVGVPAPDVRRFYLVADDCPEPAPGRAYQVWLGTGGSFSPVGDPFVPSGGSVLIRLTVDVARYDEVLITEEAAGSPPATPSTDGRSWRADLGSSTPSSP